MKSTQNKYITLYLSNEAIAYLIQMSKNKKSKFLEELIRSEWLIRKEIKEESQKDIYSQEIEKEVKEAFNGIVE